jgi:uroporphyrinogen-III synthase
VPDEPGPLAGRGVLVTRPAQQAHRLAAALESLGARVLRFPLVRIGPPSDPNIAQAHLADLEHADLVIFVSANAVRFACNLLPDLAGRLDRALVAAVGEATAAALHGVGLMAQLVPPSDSSSEALLALEPLQESAVRGRRVGIVKGEGGRELLARTLEERGANLSLVDVYRREPPADSLPEFLDANTGAIDIAVITSAQALQRFADLGGMERVRATALVLPSDRVVGRAVALGFDGPFAVPRRMSDSELAAAAVRLAAGADAVR